MTGKTTTAEALKRGDAALAQQLARRPIKPFNNNLVPRPWGGSRMLAYKGLSSVPEPKADADLPIGEAFELAAYDADPEVERFPSLVGFADGSSMELPDLLAANGEVLLGAEFVARYGSCIPFLPKTLNIKELLSVQGHPPGNTEVYVVIEADPGATIRLGFSTDIDAAHLKREIAVGRRQQAELVELLGGRKADLNTAHRAIAPWLGARGAPAEDVAAVITRQLESESDWLATKALLEALKQLYWRILDALNTIPIEAGQVIYNATPPRYLAERGRAAAAEVHALGSPDGHEILALELRRPGPTFRAWDNVRFPMRAIDVDTALDALNLRATTIEDFVVAPEAVPGRPGVFCSIDAASFRVEHLRPPADLDERISIPAESPHCLHAISGAIELRSASGEWLGRLSRGESALVPIAMGAYSVSSKDPRSEVVKVSIPL